MMSQARSRAFRALAGATRREILRVLRSTSKPDHFRGALEMTVKSLKVQQRYYLGAAVVIFATVVGTIIAYPHLPSVVPLHSDAQGYANAWGPKWSLFLYTPCLMTGIMFMFVALPWLSPKRFEVNSFRPMYLYIMIVIVTLLAYSQLLVLLSGLGVNVDVSRALEGGACLLMVLLGKVVVKTPRNFLVAIRTPGTRQ
jgi:uncharacterized membrane protein